MMGTSEDAYPTAEHRRSKKTPVPHRPQRGAGQTNYVVDLYQAAEADSKDCTSARKSSNKPNLVVKSVVKCCLAWSANVALWCSL